MDGLSYCISPIWLNVVTTGFCGFQTHSLPDYEGNSFRLEFSSIPRLGSVDRSMQQFVCELVRQNRELGRPGQTVQYANTPTARRAKRATEIVCVLEGNSARADSRLQGGGVAPWIAGNFGHLRQWSTVGLHDVEDVGSPESTITRDSSSSSSRRRLTIGARIAIPFSPLRTNLPTARQV